MHSVESISQRIVWVIQHMPAIDPQYVEVLAAVVPAAFVLWAVLRIGVPLHKIVKDYRKATTLKRSRDFFWMRVQQAMPKWSHSARVRESKHQGLQDYLNVSMSRTLHGCANQNAPS